MNIDSHIALLNDLRRQAAELHALADEQLMRAASYTSRSRHDEAALLTRISCANRNLAFALLDAVRQAS